MLQAIVRFIHNTKENQMAIEDYAVADDHFEPLTEAGSVYFNGDFAFPCCVCIHNDKQETQHPCDKCGHNVKTWDGEGNLSSESNNIVLTPGNNAESEASQ